MLLMLSGINSLKQLKKLLEVIPATAKQSKSIQNLTKLMF